MQLPGTLPSDQPPELEALFVRILGDITDRVLPDMITVGEAMWYSLAAIMLTYYGLGVALHVFPAQKLIGTILMIIFVWAMLYYYYTPLFGAMTFPKAIIAGGYWFQNLFLGNVGTDISQEIMSSATKIWERTIEDFKGLNILWALARAPYVLWSTWVVTILSLLTIVMVGIVWVAATAQVLLAVLLLAIYVLLGPICIPFLLVPALNFFFWGWFKALLKYSLYGAVAGALLAVFSGVGLAYIRAVTDALVNPLSLGVGGVTDLFSWNLSIFIFFTVGMMAIFKVDEVAASIVGAMGPSAAGMITGAAAAVATVATGGVGRALKASRAAKAVPAAKAAAGSIRSLD